MTEHDSTATSMTTSECDSSTTSTEVWSGSTDESVTSGSEESSDQSSPCAEKAERHVESCRTSQAQKLYNGAQVSYLESLMLLLRFSLIHGLSKRAFADLLRLVSKHLPASAKTAFPSSVYAIKKVFVDIFPHVNAQKIHYCSNCHALVDEQCEKEACAGYMTSHFVYVPIGQQLRAKLEGEFNMDITHGYTMVCHVLEYAYMHPEPALTPDPMRYPSNLLHVHTLLLC